MNDSISHIDLVLSHSASPGSPPPPPSETGRGGIFSISEEEKRTLVQEGYPVPTRFPLTKAEERCLKKCRRKIKNKISAQESRRKKKEYLDSLELKLQTSITENSDLKKRLETLENNNKTLISQITKLQKIAGRVPKISRDGSCQTC